MIDPPSLPSPYLLTTKKISPAPHKKKGKIWKKNLSIRKMLVNLHTHSKILLLQQKIIAKKCDFSFAYLPCCSPLDHSVQKDLKFDKKKIMNLSPAIHCTRTVCSRVPAPFNFLKLCDCDTKKKKNNELVARHSLHANRVLA